MLLGTGQPEVVFSLTDGRVSRFQDEERLGVQLCTCDIRSASLDHAVDTWVSGSGLNLLHIDGV